MEESDSIADEMGKAAVYVRSLPDESLLIQELGLLSDDRIIGLGFSMLF